MTNAVRDIAKENPRLQGVIQHSRLQCHNSRQRVISDDRLKALIDVLSRYRLGLMDVNPDMIGDAYQYLLRKFAEGSGQSAGEFYTPDSVTILMAHILDPQPGQEICDPCCGSAGLLVNSQLRGG